MLPLMLTILATRMRLPVPQVQPTSKNSICITFHDCDYMHFLLQCSDIMIMVKLGLQSEIEIGDCDFFSMQQRKQQHNQPTLATQHIDSIAQQSQRKQRCDYRYVLRDHDVNSDADHAERAYHRLPRQQRPHPRHRSRDARIPPRFHRPREAYIPRSS